jgi:hypothetical protein
MASDVLEKVVDFLRGLRWIVVLNLVDTTLVDVFMAQICFCHSRAGVHRLVVIVIVAIQRERTRA